MSVITSLKNTATSLAQKALQLGGDFVHPVSDDSGEGPDYAAPSGAGQLDVTGLPHSHTWGEDRPTTTYIDQQTGLLTAYTEGIPPLDEGMTIYDYVQGELDSYGLTQLEQLGFENTYAIGVPQALADEYGLETISDLIPIADQLTFGAEQEFFTLEGSMKYDPFVKFYGLNFQDAVSVDMGLKYSAIENGSFDVAVVYSTDGLNKKVGLKVLEDDQSFFPDYNGVFLVRDDLLEKYPEVADILNQLAGKIPTEQMAELTYQVDVEGRTVDEVAREFLVSLGLLEA